MLFNPWQVILIALAGWMNREQSVVIEYIKEENRVLRELLGKKRLRLNDDQRRRLAAKSKARYERRFLGSRCVRLLGALRSSFLTTPPLHYRVNI